MLPRKKRLDISSFNSGLTKQRRVDEESLSLFYKESPDFKAAFVVSKKVAKSAVDRNRIKRVITEAIGDFDLKGEYFFKVKKNIAKLKKEEVKVLIARIIKKLNEKTV